MLLLAVLGCVCRRVNSVEVGVKQAKNPRTVHMGQEKGIYTAVQQIMKLVILILCGWRHVPGNYQLPNRLMAVDTGSKESRKEATHGPAWNLDLAAKGESREPKHDESFECLRAPVGPTAVDGGASEIQSSTPASPIGC